MASSPKPPEPTPSAPPTTWEHYDLYCRVKDAITSLPIHFRSATNIEGISATDIFTLNSALGATIEQQMVSTLNAIRGTWDPNEDYSLYGFVRQPQTFPDVLLRRFSSTEPGEAEILMGIELKGWYLLSKEGEPSFRFTATPAVCARADLLVCVPWALKNVLSGAPTVFCPYLKPARYAAELRNYYWQYNRKTKSDPSIIIPSGDLHPYPQKADATADKPKFDGGGNFGRYARTGIIDDYIARTLQRALCGIPAQAWLEFFKLFTETTSTTNVVDRIEELRAKLKADLQAVEDPSTPRYLAILDIIEECLCDQ